MATAAFAIVKRNDKILLVKIAEPFRDAHKWNFPGGVIEADERINEGLEREILEESNITASVGECIDRFETTEPENTIHIYYAEYISGNVSIQASEIEDGGWFTPEQALSMPLAFNVRDYIIKL